MAKEVQVKNYRVVFMKKPLHTKVKVEIDIRATNKDDALEKAYSLIGSKHRLTRQQLSVKTIKEIDEVDIKNPVLAEIAGNDKVKIH
ncbi:MAG: 50S ribosomal protein L18Ae [Candidatus Heimdallarchaeota archaeon]